MIEQSRLCQERRPMSDARWWRGAHGEWYVVAQAARIGVFVNVAILVFPFAANRLRWFV